MSLLAKSIAIVTSLSLWAAATTAQEPRGKPGAEADKPVRVWSSAFIPGLNPYGVSSEDLDSLDTEELLDLAKSLNVEVGTNDPKRALGRLLDSRADYDLGDGIDTMRWEGKETCLTATEASKPIKSQATNYAIEQIKSSDDYFSQTGLNASASFGFGFFSGDIAASHVSSTYRSRFSHYLVIKVRVENRTRRAKGWELTSEATKILFWRGREAFLERCGNRFVNGVVEGGELLVLLRIETSTQKSYDSVTASLDAGGGIGGSWEAHAEFSKKLARVSTLANVKITIARRGTLDPVPIGDADTLIEYARQFPVKVRKEPWPVALELTTYGGVRGLPPFPKPAKLDEELLELEIRARELAEAVLDRNDLVHINTWASEFPPPPSEEHAARELAKVKNYIRALRRAATSCKSSPLSACDRWPDRPTPRLPQRTTWKELEVKNVACQSIGSTSNKPRLFVMVGKYAYKGDSWVGPDNYNVSVHFRSKDGEKKLRYPSHPVIVPPGTFEVCVTLRDGYPHDNKRYEPSPIRAAVILPWEN